MRWVLWVAVMAVLGAGAVSGLVPVEGQEAQEPRIERVRHPTLCGTDGYVAELHNDNPYPVSVDITIVRPGAPIGGHGIQTYRLEAAGHKCIVCYRGIQRVDIVKWGRVGQERASGDAPLL